MDTLLSILERVRDGASTETDAATLAAELGLTKYWRQLCNGKTPEAGTSSSRQLELM